MLHRDAGFDRGSVKMQGTPEVKLGQAGAKPFHMSGEVKAALT